MIDGELVRAWCRALRGCRQRSSVTSPTTVVEVVDRCCRPRWGRWPAARSPRPGSDSAARSRSVLSCSADTSVDRFLSVREDVVRCGRPALDIACDSLITVSRMLAPWPRRLSAAVLTNAPSVLTPPGWVGCSVSVSFSQLLPQIVPLHRHRGALLRNHRAVAQRRAPVYAGVSWMARAVTSVGRQDRPPWRRRAPCTCRRPRR